MDSDLQGDSFWLLVLGVTTGAKAKRLVMQSLGDDGIHEEEPVGGGHALPDRLAAA